MIVWNDSMKTFDPNIDAQHQWLIENFNALLDAVGHRQEHEELGKMLDSLQFYTKWHFEREEQCMEAHACPFAGKNRMAHQVFLSQLDQFYVQYHTTTIDHETIENIVQKLAIWFENHICNIDTRLRDSL